MTNETPLSGKRALITGGSAGIGEYAALELARLGAHIVITGRREKVASEAAERIRRETGSTVDVLTADLSLMKGTQAFAEAYMERYEALDILVHSAGGTAVRRTLTAEGAELTYATQYLARFYLNNLFLPVLKGRDARVIAVSGGGSVTKRLDRTNLHGEISYSSLKAIETISIANDYLGIEFHERHGRSGIRSYVYGPGPVRGTGLSAPLPFLTRSMFTLSSFVIGSTVAEAARDVLHLATGEHPSGLYQRRLKQAKPSKHLQDAAERNAVWQDTEREIAQRKAS
ncbi:SDR family NAD(P)-dependent oxidoreductase [Streptomyces sp. NPDC059909]|uniref:SDR family NAD(P)-dependent oxidoreductase n=1 Tax=Streptomyces sp. NPDC059909 TaxID=3346998 RepID=UPI003662AF14